jgi:hypothetical protein
MTRLGQPMTWTCGQRERAGRVWSLGPVARSWWVIPAGELRPVLVRESWGQKYERVPRGY